MTPTLDRLRAANPFPTEPDRGQSVTARDALERMLREPQPEPRRAPRRLLGRLPRGGVAVAIALGLAGGGAALAATNPFGWWSSNPGQAKYALNPLLRARTPTATVIGCYSLRCVPNGRGQLYTRIDTIRQPAPADLWTRANFLKAIAQLQASRRVTAGGAARFRRDIARVPDSFFTELRLALRYGTYGSDQSARVPPPGTPEFLVCERIGSGLSCQDLNGDRNTPVGAGVYSALPASDWRPAPLQRPFYGLPPDIHFTRAEYSVLMDLIRYATTTSTGGKPTRSTPARHS